MSDEQVEIKNCRCGHKPVFGQFLQQDVIYHYFHISCRACGWSLTRPLVEAKQVIDEWNTVMSVAAMPKEAHDQ